METHSVELHLPDALDAEDNDSFLEACHAEATPPDAERRRQRLETLLKLVERDRCRHWREETGTARLPPSGTLAPEEITSMDWRQRPTKSPDANVQTRRMCVASRASAIDDCREKRRNISKDYRECSYAWRAGEPVSPDDFPTGTYPPTFLDFSRPTGEP